MINSFTVFHNFNLLKLKDGGIVLRGRRFSLLPHLLQKNDAHLKVVESDSKIIISLRHSMAGVGNSFGFAGHIRDKLSISGPVQVYLK
jgi:hypothetical protein